MAQDSRPTNPMGDVAPSSETRSFSDCSPELGKTVAADSRALTTPQASAIQIPHYELFDVLGRGGMGVVYRARDTRLNRIVALKLIREVEETGAAERARFLAEAEAVATIEHPQVVRVYEFGQHDSRPFLAMEHLPGGTLAQQLRKEARLAPIAACILVEKLANGVQAAHDQGVVHRDLKPGNILFDSAGEPKITDFGLAKRGNLALTKTDAVMGTPGYMSPEQASGRTKFAGPAADVYALGVILYECLTGTLPFRGDDPWTVLRQVMHDEPESLMVRCSEIPRDLDLVTRKCLAKEPAERYPTASALAADLRRFLDGEPVTVRPIGSVERAVKWARRNPLRTAAYVLSTFTLLAGGFGLVAAALWQRAESARDNANAALGSLAAEKQETDRLKDRLLAESYLRSLDRGADHLRGGRPAQAIRELDACPQELRGWEWELLNGSIRREALTLRANGVVPSAVTFSPDGHRIATVWEDGGVRLWNADDGLQLAHRRLEGRLYSVTISPDCKQVAVAGESGFVHILDANGLTPLKQLAVEPGPDGRRPEALIVAFNPQGGTAAVGYENGLARVWNLETGTKAFDLTAHTRGCGSVAFSRDGERLATGDYDGGFHVWNAATGGRISLSKSDIGVASIVAGREAREWSVLREDGSVRLPGQLDAPASGKDHKTKIDHQQFVGSREPSELAITPDGRWLAAALPTGGVWLFDSKVGSGMHLKAHDSAVVSICFSPDGKRLASAGSDGAVRIWDRRPPPHDRPTPMANVTALEFRPDGRTLLAADRDGTVFEFDVESGEARSRGRVPTAERSSMLNPLPAPDVGTPRISDVYPEDLRFITLGVRGIGAGPKGDWIVAGCPAGPRRLEVKESVSLDWPANAKPEMTPTHTGGSKFRGADLASRGETTAAAVSPDGRWTAAARADGAIGIWESNSVTVLRGHEGPVAAIASSRDGKWLGSAGFDGTVRVWNVETRSSKSFTGHTGEVLAVAFMPDGRSILSAGADHTIRIWDRIDGKQSRILLGHTGPVVALAASPDGTRILSGGLDLTARVWDVATGQLLLTLLDGELGVVRVVAIAGDGNTVAIGGTRGLRIYTRRLGQKPLLTTLPMRLPLEPNER